MNRQHFPITLDITKLPVGYKLEIETQNNLYLLEKQDGNTFLVSGTNERFPCPISVKVIGSTWGGSAIKLNTIGIGMHIEMTHPDPSKHRFLTSEVQRIKVIGPNFEYEL